MKHINFSLKGLPFDRGSPLGKRAFTLVEIMVVVIIVGILATMAIAGIRKARETTQENRFKSDLRVLVGAMNTYLLEVGYFPDDTGPGAMPLGFEEYVRSAIFTEETPVGGQWEWDKEVDGIYAGIGVSGVTASPERMAKIDASIDDGDLGTGIFRSRSGGYIRVIQETDQF